MKIAYFDCQFGAAGDMLLGALIGAGLSIDAWLAELKKIPLPQDSFEVQIEDVVRCSIASKKVSVIAGTNHGSHSERGLVEIVEIINNSGISKEAKSMAQSIFRRLAEAEGTIHGIAPDKVHFHEIGAVDSIVDIIGFAVGYDLFGIEKSIVSPLPLGSGTVKTDHGIFPVPGPAVLELLRVVNAPIRHADYQHECLTPTGAAILSTIADQWGPAPEMEKIQAIGYGAGTFDPDIFPNVCRILIAESSKHGASDGKEIRFKSEPLMVLETNLDDFSPQLLAFTQEQLLKVGALDTFVTPCMMKKGRSGHLLTVLCNPSESDKLQEYLLLQTSTLGVRKYITERLVANREWIKVSLDNGDQIRIKLAYDLDGKIIHAQPEYEDCAAYASTTGTPIADVFNQVLSALRTTMYQKSKIEAALHR